MRTRIEPTFSAPESILEEPAPADSVETSTLRPALLPHEVIARGLRALGYAGYVAWTFILIAVGLPILESGRAIPPIMLGLPLFAFFVVTLLFVAADGLTRNRWWGRPLALSYALIVFFGFPFGTIISLNIVWHLLLKWRASADYFSQNRRPNYSFKPTSLRDAA
jgi:hypothetical protein